MKYILYCRKSQESEDRQVQSLEAQERELRALATKLNLEIAYVYHESKSAKTVGRPVFKKVIDVIQKGKADGILCWKLDRLARNFIDGGLVIDLIQRSVIKSIQTPSKEYLPVDPVYLMVFELGVANQFSRDLSENVKRGNREKIIKGGWPCHAPFGYLNNKADKTIYVDPVRGMFVKLMYELYATGRYSLKSLSNELYDRGLRTPAGNKVHCGTVRHIIRNPIYHGVIRYRGGYFPASFENITTKDLYDKSMLVMNGCSKPRKQKHLFPLTGLFTCGVCNCAITAEKQKGYIYYHCTNGKGICDQKRLFLRQEKLDEQLADIFDSVGFDVELIELMYEAALEKIKHDDGFNTKALENIEIELASTKLRENRLLDAYLSDSIEKDVYEEKLSEVKRDRVGLEKSLENLRKNYQDPYAIIERAKELFLFSNRAKSEYLKAIPKRKREIAYEILSNSLLADKKMAQTQLKSPYDMLARTPKNAEFSALCG